MGVCVCACCRPSLQYMAQQVHIMCMRAGHGLNSAGSTTFRFWFIMSHAMLGLHAWWCSGRRLSHAPRGWPTGHVPPRQARKGTSARGHRAGPGAAVAVHMLCSAGLPARAYLPLAHVLCACMHCRCRPVCDACTTDGLAAAASQSPETPCPNPSSAFALLLLNDPLLSDVYLVLSNFFS